MSTLIKNSDELVIKLNSMALAVMIAAAGTTNAIARIKLFAGLQNNVIILGVVFLLACAGIFVKKEISLGKYSVVTLALTTVMYGATLLFNGSQCNLTIIQFIFYAIVPIYLIGQKLDGELVVRYTLYLSLITLPFIQKFFDIQYEQYQQAYMGNIYTVLTPVLFAIIHFKMYGKQANIVTKIAYLYNLYVLILMIMYANRGAVVCIIFCIAIVLMNDYDGEEKKKLSILKLSIIIVACIGIIAFLINALEILEALAVWCQENFSSVPSFISKMIKYMSAGDISDGRDNISQVTWEAIAKNPILGNGIKTFEAYTAINARRSWVYPHNYIIQYLFEMGVIVGMVPVYFSLSLAAKTLFRRIAEKKEFVFCAGLVLSCIPKLLFSTEPWTSTTIWMLVTYSMMYSSQNIKIKINYN